MDEKVIVGNKRLVLDHRDGSRTSPTAKVDAITATVEKGEWKRKVGKGLYEYS